VHGILNHIGIPDLDVIGPDNMIHLIIDPSHAGNTQSYKQEHKDDDQTEADTQARPNF
jgi:hypothetical protein